MELALEMVLVVEKSDRLEFANKDCPKPCV